MISFVAQLSSGAKPRLTRCKYVIPDDNQLIPTFSVHRRVPSLLDRVALQPRDSDGHAQRDVDRHYDEPHQPLGRTRRDAKHRDRKGRLAQLRREDGKAAGDVGVEEELGEKLEVELPQRLAKAERDGQRDEPVGET